MKTYFKIYVRIMDNSGIFYLSDGRICVENDAFEGYITDDYITGSFKENRLYVETLTYDYDDQICNYCEFEAVCDFFEIPETYVVESHETGVRLQLDIKERINNVSEIEKTSENLKIIRSFYGIPDI